MEEVLRRRQAGLCFHLQHPVLSDAMGLCLVGPVHKSKQLLPPASRAGWFAGSNSIVSLCCDFF